MCTGPSAITYCFSSLSFFFRNNEYIAYFPIKWRGHTERIILKTENNVKPHENTQTEEYEQVSNQWSQRQESMERDLKLGEKIITKHLVAEKKLLS